MGRRSWQRRVLAVVVLGGIGALLAPAGTAAARDRAPSSAAASTEAETPEAVGAYAHVLVDTAVADLSLPMLSVPPPVAGVLGTRSAVITEYVQVLREAAASQQALIAYVAALQAAAAHGPATTAVARVIARARSRCNGDFACFKACTLNIESHGDYGAISPGGTYRGAWQFDRSTWGGAVARAGHPEWSGSDPAQAPPGVQDAAAQQLYRERGNQPWGGRC